MISINAKAVIDWVAQLGFGGLVVLALVGLQQGWWFFARERDELKSQLAAMTADRNEWKLLAMSSLHAAERTVGAASAVLPPVAQGGVA